MRDPAPKQTPSPQQAPARPGMPEARPFGAGAGEPGYSFLDLQRAVGNQKLQRLLRRPAASPGGVGPPPVQRRVSSLSLQRAPTPSVGGEGEGVSFKYSVRIDKEMDSDQLLVTFVRQYRELATEAAAKDVLAREGWKWTGKAPTVTAKDVGKRYLLITVRDSSVKPGTEAERQGRKEYFEGLSAEDQAAINAETDSQFWQKTQYRVGQALGTSADDKEMSVYWQVLRDELVRKRQAIAALPPEIRQLLFDPTVAPPIGLQSLGAVLRIAAKIAHLTPDELAEFRSRGFTTTAGWDAYEASVDRFLAERKQREATARERRTLETRLYGLEALYDEYRLYLTTLKSNARLAGMGAGNPMAIGGALGGQSSLHKQRSALAAHLRAAGFPGGLADFEKLIESYEQVFERETLALAGVMLDQYEQRLATQEATYRQPAGAQALYEAVSQSGALQGYDEAKAIKNEPSYSTDSDYGDMLELQEKAKAYQAAKGRGAAKIRALAGAHPLVGEGDFDHEALARASSPAAAQARMLAYIAARRSDVAETRKNLRDKPRMIYGLDKLLQASIQAQRIQGGTIYGKIVQDHIKDVNWDQAIPKIVLGIIGVIAGLLTGGGGTFAVVAGGTALGIGAYQAVAEFREYEMKSAAHGAQLTSDDPSFAWVIVAVIGAGFDVAAFASVLPKLRPAVQAFNAGTEADDVVKLAEKLDKLTDVEEGIRRSVLRAAEAEVEARAAWKAVLRPPAALRMVLLPGAEEFGRLVYAVYLTVKRGIREFQVFVKSNEAITLIGKAEDLSVDDMAKLKTGYLQAVEEMEKVAAHGKTLGMADNEIRSFMNLRANTKNMTADELTTQMNAWKASKDTGVPFGFKNAEQFADFQKVATAELKKALKKTDPKAEAFLQGSSLSGVSYKRHLPFDEASDFDVAITSRFLMRKAETELGVEAAKSPRRIGPLTGEQIAELGLDKFVTRLGDVVAEPAVAGAAAKPPRQVNVMLFDTEEAVRKPIGEASTETSRAAVPLKVK